MAEIIKFKPKNVELGPVELGLRKKEVQLTARVLDKWAAEKEFPRDVATAGMTSLAFDRLQKIEWFKNAYKYLNEMPKETIVNVLSTFVPSTYKVENVNLDYKTQHISVSFSKKMIDVDKIKPSIIFTIEPNTVQITYKLSSI